MSQKTSPWIEGAYGWDFGEGGWNTGMDQNLLKFSFLFDRNVDTIVSSLPAAVNGQAHYNTTDNRIYFAVGTTYYSTLVPKWFTLTIKSTGEVWQFNGTSLEVLESLSSLDTRLDAVEVTISSLGTAAFQDVADFATQAALDVVEAQSQAYTDVLRDDVFSVLGTVPYGISFPLLPEDGFLFVKTPERKMYYYEEGGAVWQPVDEELYTLLATHESLGSATDNVHGLRTTTVAIGSGSVATATNSVAIGTNASSVQGTSVALGRDCVISGTGSINHNIGNANTITGTLSSHTRNVVIGASNTLTDSFSTNIVGDLNAVSGVNNCSVLGRANTFTGGSFNIRIGHGDVLADNCTDCIAIGRAGAIPAATDKSVAIGHGATVTASNQVVLGSASAAVLVPGSFSVTGAKSFMIPHPEPGKETTHLLQHNSYEGPVEGGTIYRYVVEVVGSSSKLNLPGYFKYLNKDVDVWCQAKGHFGQAYGEITGNTLEVFANTPGTYSILIMGTRNDPAMHSWAGAEREV